MSSKMWRSSPRNPFKGPLSTPIALMLVALLSVYTFYMYSNFIFKAEAAVCSNTSVGLPPLTDLGSGTYLGFEGGLYPGGSNVRPAAHEALGASIAATIQPLDQNGNPDPNGKIVYTSFGMSNTRAKFLGIQNDGTLSAPDAFKFQADAYSGKNPKVAVINGAQGGKDINDWLADDPLTWNDLINVKLPAEGGHYKQVQVAWLLHAERIGTGTFPENATVFKNKVADLVRMAKTKLPNLKIIYISSRTYGGYSDNVDRGEPYSHDTAWGVKWVIEDQINGVGNLGLDVSPWLAWGPYIWADGVNPRLDGHNWLCTDYKDDGTHPNATGVKKVADNLLYFSIADSTACQWFNALGCDAPVPTLTPTPTALPPTDTPTPTLTPTPSPTTFACAAPVMISSSDTKPTSGGTVTLSWSSVPGATQYRVQRQKNATSWDTRQTSSATSFSGADGSSDPNWRVYVQGGNCSPLPGPATTIDP